MVTRVGPPTGARPLFSFRTRVEILVHFGQSLAVARFESVFFEPGVAFRPQLMTHKWKII